jgi:transposase
MEHYAGIDVSLEYSSVCVVDASGKIIREGKVASEPDALISWLRSLGYELSRIGLEAGPLSQWLFAAMRKAGLAVELLETRHVRKAFEAMPVKSDRNDARGIAQLMRLGWFRPVHCKSMGAQEVRAVLTARKLVQTKLLDVENSLRGILRGFGLKVGKTTARSFAGRIQELVKGHPNLEAIGKALLSVRAVLLREFNAFEKRVRAMARSDARTKLLMSTPAVGPIVALTYASGAAFRVDAEEISVRRDRLLGTDQQDRRCLGARGALPGRSRHADKAGQRLFAAQELGDADCQTSRHEQSQGRAGAETRGDPASHARQRNTIQRCCCSSLTGRNRFSGGSRHQPSRFIRHSPKGRRRKRSPFAGTMDQVRPSSGMSTHLTM